MPPIPIQSDIPSSLNPVFHPPMSSISDPTSISNIILLLPGLGDTSTNFSSFARALNLPETLCITLQPPFPLPFPLGSASSPTDSDQTFSWTRPEDLLVDSTSGQLDSVESKIDDVVEMVAKQVVVDVLIAKCGWQAQQIQLFGFGMGGTVALRVGLEVERILRLPQPQTKLQNVSEKSELGGIMTIGGPLPLSTPLPTLSKTGSGDVKSKSPVILLGGTRGLVFGGGDNGDNVMKRLKERFDFVEVVKWRKAMDLMPSNREEVVPMMSFWGRTLKSTKGVPKGSIQII